MPTTGLTNAGRSLAPSSLHLDDPYHPKRFDKGEVVEQLSLDPFAGGTANGKPIFSLDQIVDNANRTGWNWNVNNNGVNDDKVLGFSFFNTQEDFFGTGYINDLETTAFSEFFDFQAFTPEQRVAARGALQLWDDLINVKFVETSVADADIRFGNTDTGGAQAYAYLPFGTIFNDPAGSGGFTQLEDLGGDVWIDFGVPSNFFPLEDSYYSVLTLIHELGHAIGLSHPGEYDALNDADGDGVPDPISYGGNADFAQDSLQYTVMSYFDAFETGAQHIDWSLLNFAYSATPLVHDIAAVQALYGADTTTRTGNTTYGFNSTADRAAFDFTLNTRPIVTIYDAGGTDTIDFSGWSTDSIINLNEGAFSSGGGVEKFLTLEEVNANRAAAGLTPRSQATYDAYFALFATPQGLTNGLFRDNISIAYGTVIENARGGAGDDLIIANQFANTIRGGRGKDTVSYETATSGVLINLDKEPYNERDGDDRDHGNARRNNDANGQTGGGALGDRLISIENIIGSQFDDDIKGDDRNNVINGGAGGNDKLDGGDGIDTISYEGTAAGVIIDLGRREGGGAAAGDTIRRFENIIGTDFADSLRGDNDRNSIWGGDGDDTISGGGDRDQLYGGGGNDTIDGGRDNDQIYAGEGADILTGGRGNDRFIFESVDDQTDTITDFDSRNDKIDLSALDAITGTADNDAFTFIGSNVFSNVAGQLRYFGGNLLGDLDGDGVADFTIAIGSIPLVQSDLVL